MLSQFFERGNKLTDISSRPMVLNTGKVRITRDQDFLQFSFVGLLAVAVVLVVGYLYYSGIFFGQIYPKLGPYFTAGFSCLLVAGVGWGLYESWNISIGLNALKRHSLDASELKRYFGVENFTGEDFDLLEQVIEVKLFRGADRINHIGNVTVALGLIGTATGLVGALSGLAEVQTIEDIAAHLPDIIPHLPLAFTASIVGLVEWLVVLQIYRFVRAGALDLKIRILRSISTHGKVRSSNA